MWPNALDRFPDMSFRSAVLEFIERSQQSENVHSMVDDLRALGSMVGLDQLIILNLWNRQPDKLWPVISSYQSEVFTEYERLKLQREDPIWLAAKVTTRSFRWTDVWDEAGPNGSIRAHGFLRAMGICEALTVPVFNERFQRSVVTLAADRSIRLSDDDAALLSLAVVIFRRSGGAQTLDHMGRARSPDVLSAREREVLRWTAAGKSAWEISAILNLSEKTVARHLLNIRGKLKAANTVHAVAEAIRYREIVL